MDLDSRLFAIGSALAAMMATFAVIAGLGVIREWRRRRSVQHVLEDLQSMPVTTSSRSHVLQQEEPESALQRLLLRFPQLGDVEDLLVRSGVGWSLERFILLSVTWSAALALPVWMATRSGLGFLVSLIIGAWLPKAYVNFKATRRVRALEAQLPSAIDHLSRAVRAGHPLSSGLKMLSEESEEPLASEFRAVFEEQRWGLPFEEALMGLGDRVDLPDVRILITAILVQREVGGNLAEILEKVASTMRVRFTVRRQVRVYTVQGRMSGYILAGLPVVVGFFIFLINREYMEILYTHPMGQVLLGFAVVLQCVGFLWIRKIVNVQY